MHTPSDTLRPMSKEDQAIEQHRSRLNELQARWDEALPYVAEALGIEISDDTSRMLGELEAMTAGAWLAERAKNPDAPVLMGIAGPGASGKGTLGEYLEQNVGFTKVINTTTRQPRHYEVDGIHYFFTDENGFKIQADGGEFLQWNEKPGRGLYGVRRDEVEARLAQSGGVGCVVEESPANLIRTLGSETVERMPQHPLNVVLYIMPPHPIIETSARRLYGRSSANEAERQLTIEDINSTLGDRQIDEFRDLAALKENPNVHLVIVINDKLDESNAKLQQLFAKV